VADNDERRSAHPVVEEFKRRSFLPVRYTCVPTENICLARNAAVA